MSNTTTTPPDAPALAIGGGKAVRAGATVYDASRDGCPARLLHLLGGLIWFADEFGGVSRDRAADLYTTEAEAVAARLARLRGERARHLDAAAALAREIAGLEAR